MLVEVFFDSLGTAQLFPDARFRVASYETEKSKARGLDTKGYEYNRRL